MKKKILVVILSVVMMTVIICNSSKNASAEALTIATLTATEVVILAGALITAGVALHNSQDAVAAACDYWVSANQSVRASLKSSFNNIKDGAISLGGDIYNNMVDWVDSLSGWNTKTIDSPYTYCAQLGYFSGEKLTADSAEFLGHTIELVYAFEYATYKDVLHHAYTVHIDGQEANSVNGLNVIYNQSGEEVGRFADIYLVGDGYTPYFSYEMNASGMLNFVVNTPLNKYLTGERDVVGVSVYPATTYTNITYDYTTKDVTSESWYGDLTKDDEIAIPVTTDLDGLVGLTAEDVLNIPTDDTDNPPVVNPLDLTIPQSVEIDFTPLTSIGNLLSTKFPFCLPWDLRRIIDTLNVPPTPPKWHIDFDDKYFIGGGTIDIDFAEFEDLAKIVRWAVFIIFSIGLIKLTRTLIRS